MNSESQEFGTSFLRKNPGAVRLKKGVIMLYSMNANEILYYPSNCILPDSIFTR